MQEGFPWGGVLACADSADMARAVGSPVYYVDEPRVGASCVVKFLAEHMAVASGECYASSLPFGYDD